MKMLNQMKLLEIKYQERICCQKRRQCKIKERSREEFRRSGSTGMITTKSLEKTNSTATSQQQMPNNMMGNTINQRSQEQSLLTSIWRIFKKTITKIFPLKEAPSVRAYRIPQRKESTLQCNLWLDLFFRLPTIVFLQINPEIKLSRRILLKFLR